MKSPFSILWFGFAFGLSFAAYVLGVLLGGRDWEDEFC